MKPYFPLAKILPPMTSRRVVQETYGINYQMHYNFSLRNCHSFNFSNYHEIRKESVTKIAVFTRLSKNVKCVAINFRGNHHLISFYERGFLYDTLTVFSGRGERRQWIMVEVESLTMGQVPLVKRGFA